MQGIGHNFLPLHERIFSDPEVSVDDVLLAVSTHLEISNKSNLEQLSATAALLALNKDRLPDQFDEAQIGSALNLLSHVDNHSAEVAEARLGVIAAAEDFVTRLKAVCKPLDDRIAPLEKAIRARITDAMISQIDAHNNERSTSEDQMGCLTLRASSGTRATLSMSDDHEIEVASEIPREFCTPCPKLIGAAIKSGKEVPGVKQKRKPTLRITTK
jgi:hypothetical protein